MGLKVEYLKKEFARILPIPKEFRRLWWGFTEKRYFLHKLNNLEVKCIIPNRSEKSGNTGPAFCIVHWNALDFLLLNIMQLELIYPNSKIYVLDNGSQELCLEELANTLRQFKNVTLFSVRSDAKSDHTAGLQVLLNYSAMQSDEFSVFLDQDCILCHNIDDLLMKFRSQKDLLLIGARDYVRIPKDYVDRQPFINAIGDRKLLRAAYKMVHGSLMIMQPTRIVKLFGKIALSTHLRAWEEARDGNWMYEQYHSISYRTRGHILYLETKMHSEIPLLTSYSYQDIVYAYHAWYSSRTILLSDQDSLDGIPVSLLLNLRKEAYEYMERIYESTLRATRANPN